VPISAIHQVITDKQAPKGDLDELRKAGVEVTLI
jgi:DeoR/GlpR family transcriptional regulator of sugar metabolism